MHIIQANDLRGVVEHIVQSITAQLAHGQKVLWLVSGGSAVEAAATASHQLRSVDGSKVSITLMDERYGPVGHADENWQQLLDAGFEVPDATLYRPLTGAGHEETTAQFEAWLERALAESDYVIGLFGIGADGHTAGIKPHSEAIGTDTLAAGYVGDDFARITITPACLKRVDEAVVQVFGEAKHAAVRSLLHEQIEPAEQPAQLLKSIPNVTLYTDYTEK